MSGFVCGRVHLSPPACWGSLFLMKVYRIRDWVKWYEASDNKKTDGPLSWVAIRTKTDGLGYRRIASQKDRTDLLAGWYLLVGIAAKQPRAERGKITRDGRPLTCEEMAMMTGFPAQVFDRALVFFSDPAQGWLDSDEIGQIRTDSDSLGQVPPTLPTIPTIPTKEEAPAACLPFSSEAFKKAWDEFQTHRRQLKKPITPLAAEKQLEQLRQMGEARAIAAINHTIARGWQGIREPDAREAAPAPREAYGMDYFERRDRIEREKAERLANEAKAAELCADLLEGDPAA